MMIDLNLIKACAPSVAPQTIAQIIQVESQGNPYAIHVNGGPAIKTSPESLAEAMLIAEKEIQAGHNIDLGLMQINSRHLSYFGYSLKEAFDPCHNIQAGANILSNNYQRAAKQVGAGQVALQQALSAYNTGNFQSGLVNGYVDKYYPSKLSDELMPRNSLFNFANENPYTAATTVYRCA